MDDVFGDECNTIWRRRGHKLIDNNVQPETMGRTRVSNIAGQSIKAYKIVVGILTEILKRPLLDGNMIHH